MRLVHLSDLHLGFRQYQRLTPTGVNQREADVAVTFRNVITRVIALNPDLVIVAGDVFHTVRPSNQAILTAFLQFARLVRELPNAAVVMIAGNHDTPRTSETGGILPLLAQLGVTVVDRDIGRLSFDHLDLQILAIPDVPGLVRPSLIPEGNARYNVLVLHGEVQGALPTWATVADRAAVEVTRDELSTSRWDYVALGHYHVHQEIAPNAYYSGSIEYTSVNTWGERYEEKKGNVSGKGFIEHDLATGRHEFHPIDAARPLEDLEPIRARGMVAADIDARIRAAVDGCKGGIDDKIVRLVVFDVERHIARELDHKAIREFKRRALNFHLDIRRPDVFRLHGSGAPGGRQTIDLKDIVAEKLRWRTIDADVDRQMLIDNAVRYIEEATVANVAPAALIDT